jgi:surfactin synthase thioesterase subunit
VTRYLPPAAPGAAPDGLALYCFPFAGGGATAYSGWQRRLGGAVRVRPVRLPGREARSGEPRFTDLGALVADLDEQLGPELDRGPHLLFGHSMGAMIAYSLAHRRLKAGRRPPRALLLSAYRPPHLGVPHLFNTVAARRTEEALVDTLAAIGGVPRELLEHAEWRALLLPVARDDLLLCASAPQRPADPIPVRLHLFAGADDALAAPGEVAEWARHGSRGSELSVFPGGHFYLRDGERDFLAHLSALLVRYTVSAAQHPLHSADYTALTTQGPPHSAHHAAPSTQRPLTQRPLPQPGGSPRPVSPQAALRRATLNIRTTTT